MENKAVPQEPDAEILEDIRPFKLVLLGESSVGKTSLALRFVKKLFYVCQDSTIGDAFFTQTIYSEDLPVKFEIWDTAGQERYHCLSPMYFRSAHAAIVVYDITDETSFERAKIWVREIQKYATNDIVIALAGNKVDLCDTRRVEFNESRRYALEYDLILMETSAKTNINVTEIFKAIADKLPKSKKTMEKFQIRNTERVYGNFSCCN